MKFLWANPKDFIKTAGRVTNKIRIIIMILFFRGFVCLAFEGRICEPEGYKKDRRQKLR